MNELSLAAVLVATLLASPALAGAMTVDEAVDLARKNNHGMREAEFGEGAAAEAVSAARAAFHPTIGAAYSYMLTEEPSAGTDELSSAGVTASYNVFSGFADSAGLGRARAELSAARADLLDAEAALTLRVKEAYIEVLRARRTLSVARDNVGRLERQLRQTRLFYEQGLLARNDVLRVDLELASGRQAAIEAEGSERISLRRLENVLATPLEPDVPIEDLSTLPSEEVADGFEDLAARMFAGRGSLRALGSRRVAAAEAVRAARGAWFPSVDLSLSHDWYGDDALPDGRESAADEATQASVSLTWTLYDGFGTGAGVREAEYSLRIAEERVEEEREALVLELRTAIESARTARARLDVAEAAVRQAEENYRVTENRVREREATTVDLLDAGFFVTRAENDRTGALYDLHIAFARIARSLGERQ